MPRRRKSSTSGGCIKALYWLLFGWVIWLFKWIFIGLNNIGRFIISKSRSGIEKLSNWMNQRLENSGHAFGLKKVRAAVTGVFVILVVASCGILGATSNRNDLRESATITPTSMPTFTLTPEFTATNTSIPPTPTPLYGTSFESRCIAKETNIQIATVTRVIDGDTIVVEMDGQEFHLRYIGIDSPEDTEPLFELSKKANEELVLGKTVVLVKDLSEVDSFGRLLRYVFVDEVFVNYMLIQNGVAVAGSWPPDTACLEVFKGAESAARSENVGIWVATPTVLPTALELPTPTEVSRSGGIIPIEPEITTEPVGNCDPSYPTVCIPPAPPDLNCPDIPYSRFQVLPPDPHNFDRDGNGIGCESG